MKLIYEKWLTGWLYILGDDIVSFGVFFTSIFMGCAWMYNYCELSTAVLLSIVMLGYVVNAIIFSWLKGNAEGTRLEVVFSFCYLAVFITLIVIGLIINWKIHLSMMAIVLLLTAISVWLSETQLPAAFVIWLFILSTVWIVKISGLPLFFKIIIPTVYLLLIPFIAYYEDCSAAQNIFELAYDNSWDPEYEKRMREQNSKDIVV